jgi:hypothetical protein
MRKTKTQILSQPLILSLIGIFLGSVLIPTLSSFYSDYRYKVDKKNEIAFSVIEKSQLTNSKLNNVFTSIEIFNKNGSFLLDTEIRTFQTQKNIEITNLYLNFNETAWHWQISLLQKVQTLNYNKTDISSIKNQLKKYKKNLVKRTHLLGQLWTVSLRDEFDFVKMDKTGLKIRKEFDSLENLDNTLIIKLAQFIKEN